MKYQDIIKGKFISRPNRFIAVVEIDGREERAHVKNTGRCRELLQPGASVYLEDFRNRMGSRKLEFSLVGVEKEVQRAGARHVIMINMDSQAPNKVVKEAMQSGSLLPAGFGDVSYIKPEYTYGNSRIDFYAEDSTGRKLLMEVKGVTLEEGGTARFPDAPTERGIKHIEELIAAKRHGFEAVVCFVIQMKGVERFEPNYSTHAAFGEALCRAADEGVEVIAYDCVVEEDGLVLDKPVPVYLERG